MILATEMTKAYRAYLSEVEGDGRRSLTVLAWLLGVLALAHPLLFILALPSILLSWLTLFRRARLHFITLLYRSEILLRALRFDDYDPELQPTMQLGQMEGVPPTRLSKLETFWRSFDASCRSFGVHAVDGTDWLWWLALPLIVMTIGLLAAPGLREQWNWLPLPEASRGPFVNGGVFIIVWLVGVGAAILGKMVIQMALTGAAWDAVVQMDQPVVERPQAYDPQAARDSFIRWGMPGEEDQKPRKGAPQR
jgi:hypothetical protein